MFLTSLIFPPCLLRNSGSEPKNFQLAREKLIRCFLCKAKNVIQKFFQISKLRGQVINRATDSELEKRLRALTETLIEKQQSIEGLSADKTTLGLELERLKADKSRQVRIL